MSHLPASPALPPALRLGASASAPGSVQASQRAEAIAQTVGELQALEATLGATRQGLNAMAGCLARLARRAMLFPPSQFPLASEAGAEQVTRHLLWRSAARDRALVLTVAGADRLDEAAELAGWVVIAGVRGTELVTLFDEVADPVEPKLRVAARVVLGQGNSVVLTPGRMHSQRPEKDNETVMQLRYEGGRVIR